VRTTPPPPPPGPSTVHPGIDALHAVGEAFLMVRVRQGIDNEAVSEALRRHEVCGKYLFHVLVSMDVDIRDPMMVLWGWFTRFDPLADIHPSEKRVVGNRLLFSFPVVIDATWKPGYRKPVEIAPETEKRVDEKWSKYGIK
jgi:3-polyprenyl-4-hydroxybenzoate decarboxylase